MTRLVLKIKHKATTITKAQFIQKVKTIQDTPMKQKKKVA